MLGKLARWLRLLGFDARYERRMPDHRLVEVANAEDRTLLTRDRRLVRRRACRRYCLVESDDPREQVVQVVEELGLDVRRQRWFDRCLDCNRPLEGRAKEEIRDRVPSYVYANHDVFAACPSCERVYWRGTHVDDLDRRLRELMQELERRGFGCR